jgi:methionyl aminopeptidase
MNIRLKTPQDIEKLKKGGQHLHRILRELVPLVKVGVSSEDIDKQALVLARACGAEPAFLNYQPEGVERPFPASICISVNEVVVHGIPNERPVIFEEGDLVTLDMGLIFEGLITDSAITIPVGEVDAESKALIKHTKKALEIGISAVKLGGHIGDIGSAISEYVDQTGFFPADDLAGHGVGYKVHEDPFVPNTGIRGKGPKIVSGMVLAIEPMLLVGSSEVIFESDSYTVRTKSGGRSAHFEHTIAITDNGVEILT